MIKPDRNVIETRTFYTWMGDDGIARTQVKSNAEVVLADAKENSQAVNRLPSTEKFTLIVDTRDIKSISKEARDHFSLRGRESKVFAFAILIDSPLSMVIGNFFMGLNKPRVPVKLFTNEIKAVAWCQSLKKEIVHD